MNDHPDDVTLDAYVEALLDPAARAGLERHLAACARCRDEVARQASLLEALRALPDRVSPGVDLRPGIRAGIGGRADASGTRAALRALRALRVPLAAAAVLLIALTAAVTVLVLGDRRADRVAEHGRMRPEVASAADFRDARSRYVSTAEELALLVERHRASLAPETVALLEQSLRTIDAAILEADAALRADPGSPMLRDMILASHQRKVEVLRWATELAGRT